MSECVGLDCDVCEFGGFSTSHMNMYIAFLRRIIMNSFEFGTKLSSGMSTLSNFTLCKEFFFGTALCVNKLWIIINVLAPLYSMWIWWRENYALFEYCAEKTNYGKIFLLFLISTEYFVYIYISYCTFPGNSSITNCRSVLQSELRF